MLLIRKLRYITICNFTVLWQTNSSWNITSWFIFWFWTIFTLNLHLEPNFYESVSITPNPSLFLLYYFVFASPRLKCPSGQRSKTFEISFNPAPSLFFLFYYLLVFPTSGFRKIQMFTHLYQLINWPSISLAEYKVSSPLKRDCSQQQIG